ncbi:hypothetical protein JCM17380_15520 [Desulfosporosinus burensis]
MGNQNAIAIESSVNESHAYQEIILNKAYPLEVLREAISNAHDYGATRMSIITKVQTIKGKRCLVITFWDDGSGMDIEGLKRFAGLGFSESYEKKQLNPDSSFVGEKGHGTLLYFCSDEVSVTTKKDGKSYSVSWLNPWEKVCEGLKLSAIPVITDCSSSLHETTIKIIGYENNDSSTFAHHKMKDYILWFTKFGANENQFQDIPKSTLTTIKLQGVDRSEPEQFFWGHPFPQESKDLEKLITEHGSDAPKYYCRRIIKSGTLPDFPEYKWHAVISLEGDTKKRQHN